MFCFCWWLGPECVPFNMCVVFNLLLRNTTFSVHQRGTKCRCWNPKSQLLGSSSWACYCAYCFVVKIHKTLGYRSSPSIFLETTKNSPGKESPFSGFYKTWGIVCIHYLLRWNCFSATLLSNIVLSVEMAIAWHHQLQSSNWIFSKLLLHFFWSRLHLFYKWKVILTLATRCHEWTLPWKSWALKIWITFLFCLIFLNDL